MAQSPRESGVRRDPLQSPPARAGTLPITDTKLRVAEVYQLSPGHSSRSPAEHRAWAGTNQGPRELERRRGQTSAGALCPETCRPPERQRIVRIGTVSAQLPWRHTLSSACCVWTGDAESCKAPSKPGGARLCRKTSRYQETVDDPHAEIRIKSYEYSAMKRHEPQIRTSALC